jgi:hypothetical protein
LLVSISDFWPTFPIAGQHFRFLANISHCWSAFPISGQHFLLLVSISDFWPTFPKANHESPLFACILESSAKFQETIEREFLAALWKTGLDISFKIFLYESRNLGIYTV